MNHEELMINYLLHASLGTGLPLKESVNSAEEVNSQELHNKAKITSALLKLWVCVFQCRKVISFANKCQVLFMAPVLQVTLYRQDTLVP